MTIVKSICIISIFLICAVQGDKVDNKDPVKIVADQRNGPVEYELFMYATDTMKICKLKLPNGTVYELIPQKNLTDPNIEIPSLYGKDKCGFKILNVTKSYVGDYELDANITELMGSEVRIIQPVIVVIEERIDVVPNDAYYVYPGQNLEFFLSENVENLNKCELIKNNTDFDNIKNVSSVVNNCGINIQNVTNEMNGTWTIRAIGDITFFNKVDIILKEFPSIEPNITLPLGIRRTIILGPVDSIYCLAINPSGQIVAENSGQCVVKIDRVTQKDDGKWTVKVGFAGAISTFVYEYYINVIDLGEQNDGEILTHFEIAENKDFLQIECILFVKSMKSCRIVRSDGEVFILDKGIGSERYKYFTSPKESSNIGNDFVSCGIHVQKPNDLDLQPWKCVIVHGENDTETGSVINMGEYVNINNTDNGNGEFSTTKSIETAKSDSFNMMCVLPSSISYCWFKAPNGTVYSMFPGTKHEDYEYYGIGLKMGHCGITIKSASVEDRGTWTCNMGTTEVMDNRVRIDVKIYDSPLVAPIKYFSSNSKKRITCKTFDNSSLEYCRFINPVGEGINPSKDSKLYSDNGTNLDVGYCSLTLLSPERYECGFWKCIGKPYLKNVEYFDTIYIDFPEAQTDNSSLVYGVLLGVFFAILAVLTIVLITLTLKRKIIHRRNTNFSETTQSSNLSDVNSMQKFPLP